jgi:hypothetical protein
VLEVAIVSLPTVGRFFGMLRMNDALGKVRAPECVFSLSEHLKNTATHQTLLMMR